MTKLQLECVLGQIQDLDALQTFIRGQGECTVGCDTITLMNQLAKGEIFIVWQIHEGHTIRILAMCHCTYNKTECTAPLREKNAHLVGSPKGLPPPSLCALARLLNASRTGCCRVSAWRVGRFARCAGVTQLCMNRLITRVAMFPCGPVNVVCMIFDVSNSEQAPESYPAFTRDLWTTRGFDVWAYTISSQRGTVTVCVAQNNKLHSRL